MRYYCNICKKDITRGVFSYSKDKFGRPLCIEHQELERRTQEDSIVKQGLSETDPKEIIIDDA